MTQEVWHLGVVIGFVVVSSSDWVQESLVGIGVDDLVTKVVVTLLPIILWEIRRVEVYSCHI